MRTKNDINNKAKIIIYKALPKVEYEKVFFCQTANDIWKSLLNFHQEKCQAKDEDFDLVHELVILENLIDKHLDKIDTCATSSNVVNEGINDEDYMNQLQSELNPKSWSDTDEGEDHHPVCDECKLDKTPNKVQSETEHFCYDPFILEFSKLENEFKHFCNIDLKTISKHKSSKTFEGNLEKEIILEDKMSRLESNIEIDLECKTCQDYKLEIKRLNERAKILAKFEESSKSLKYLLSCQKSFNDKTGLGFSSDNSSTSKSKQIKIEKLIREI